MSDEPGDYGWAVAASSAIFTGALSGMAGFLGSCTIVELDRAALYGLFFGGAGLVISWTGGALGRCVLTYLERFAGLEPGAPRITRCYSRDAPQVIPGTQARISHTTRRELPRV